MLGSGDWFGCLLGVCVSIHLTSVWSARGSFCPTFSISWSFPSSSAIWFSEAYHNSVSILACFRASLLHLAISLDMRVVLSKSQKASTRVMFSSGSSMRRQWLLVCRFRPIFCSCGYSSDSSSLASGRWIGFVAQHVPGPCVLPRQENR